MKIQVKDRTIKNNPIDDELDFVAFREGRYINVRPADTSNLSRNQAAIMQIAALRVADKKVFINNVKIWSDVKSALAIENDKEAILALLRR